MTPSTDESRFLKIVRIVLGMYALAAVAYSFYAVYMALEPALFWHQIFSDYFPSEGMRKMVNKLTLLFTLLTLVLPAIALVLLAVWYDRKRNKIQ